MVVAGWDYLERVADMADFGFVVEHQWEPRFAVDGEVVAVEGYVAFGGDGQGVVVDYLFGGGVIAGGEEEDEECRND